MGAHSFIKIKSGIHTPNIITLSSISQCSGYSTCNYINSGIISQSYLNNSAHNCYRNCAYVLEAPTETTHTNFSTFWNNTATERSLYHVNLNHSVEYCIIMKNRYSDGSAFAQGIITIENGILYVQRSIIINNTSPVLFGVSKIGSLFASECILSDNSYTHETSGAVQISTTDKFSLDLSYYTTDYNPELSRNTKPILADHPIVKKCSEYDIMPYYVTYRNLEIYMIPAVS